MDQAKVLSIMHQAFKSLTPSIEITEFSQYFIKVRIVSEKYAQKNIPERVELLTILLRESGSELSLNYAISYEPLTKAEYFEWYNENNGQNRSDDGSSFAAKDVGV